MKFSEENITSCALPTVIKEGRKLFSAGSVVNVHCYGRTVVSDVQNSGKNRVVLTIPDAKNTFQYECTCNFVHGGACGHVVAAMLAVNSREVLQAALFSESGEEKSGQYEQHTSGVSEAQAIPDRERARAAETTTAWYDDIPDGFSVNTIRPKPVGRIYVSEFGEELEVELRCAYNTGIPEREWIEFRRSDTVSSRYIPSDETTVICVQRSKARENVMYRELFASKLKPFHRGTFLPTIDKRDWVIEMLPQLDEKGYEIFGHKKLISSTTRYHEPRLKVRISAKKESFTCSITADFNGIPASLAELIRAVQAESHYIRLNDGSSGSMPPAWEKVLKKVFSLINAKPNVEEFSVSGHHVPLLDLLYDVADHTEVDEAYVRQRELFRNFRGIPSKPLPEHFKGTMRPYQKAGFDWFYFLQQYHFGGCLADDMGLGKTVQTLALLQNEKNEKRVKKTSMVVVPTSILFNWEHEAKAFAPSLVLARYYGPNRKRFLNALGLADVVLTTYGTLLRDIKELYKIRYNYIVLDESQNIKNPDTRILKAVRQLKGQHRLALSGTPIENSLVDLWSLFSFLNPGMFGPLASFRRNIVKPIEEESDRESLSIVKKLIFPFILRRTKKQVAKELPPKTETVVYTEMLPKQRRFYDITREALLGKIIDSINDCGIERSGMQIIEAMLRLRQVCCHPGLVDPAFIGDSGKFVLFDDYLKNIITEQHRVLVFSQFESVLKLLQAKLRAEHIPHEMLSGKTRNRQKVVMNFRQNDLPVFLISLKAGGVGLNLVEADYVIHMDPWWNPAAENQASDRAHRIGQTKEVFVYKFITVNSIEERVLRMQNKKKALTNSVIQTEKTFFKHLTKQEVISLFS